MTNKERLTLTIVLTASCISLILFAFVSLAHFLSNPVKISLPITNKLSANASEEFSLANLDLSLSNGFNNRGPEQLPESDTNPPASASATTSNYPKSIPQGVSSPRAAADIVKSVDCALLVKQQASGQLSSSIDSTMLAECLAILKIDQSELLNGSLTDLL